MACICRVIGYSHAERLLHLLLMIPDLPNVKAGLTVLIKMQLSNLYMKQMVNVKLFKGFSSV